MSNDVPDYLPDDMDEDFPIHEAFDEAVRILRTASEQDGGGPDTALLAQLTALALIRDALLQIADELHEEEE